MVAVSLAPPTSCHTRGAHRGRAFRCSLHRDTHRAAITRRSAPDGSGTMLHKASSTLKGNSVRPVTGQDDRVHNFALMVRFKNRYLIVKLVWRDGVAADNLNEGSLVQAVRDIVQACCGDLGLGLALGSLTVKYYSTYSHIAVLRCDRDISRQVLQSLAALGSVQLRRVRAEPLHIAGTLAGCVRHALMEDKAALLARAGRLSAAHQASAAAQQAKLLVMDA